MTEKQQADLIWAAQSLEKEQRERSYCKITFIVENGNIIRAERNSSFKPPGPGVPLRDTHS